MYEKKPLYRKDNTRTHHVIRNSGSDAKYDRNTKQGISKSMKKDKQRGLDFTPLFKFLLSKIGENFDDVYSEAVSRIPSTEKHVIKYMFDDTRDSFRFSESTQYSTLTVDENGLIQKTNPNLSVEHLFPSCPCCTHTFNGHVLTNKYQYDDRNS